MGAHRACGALVAVCGACYASRRIPHPAGYVEPLPLPAEALAPLVRFTRELLERTDPPAYRIHGRFLEASAVVEQSLTRGN